MAKNLNNPVVYIPWGNHANAEIAHFEPPVNTSGKGVLDAERPLPARFLYPTESHLEDTRESHPAASGGRFSERHRIDVEAAESNEAHPQFGVVAPLRKYRADRFLHAHLCVVVRDAVFEVRTRPHIQWLVPRRRGKNDRKVVVASESKEGAVSRRGANPYRAVKWTRPRD